MESNLTITIKYSCHSCGIFRRAIQVPARTPDEDVIAWTEAAVRIVARDHRTERPGCKATSLSELMIPITGTSRVGGPVEH